MTDAFYEEITLPFYIVEAAMSLLTKEMWRLEETGETGNAKYTETKHVSRVLADRLNANIKRRGQ